MELDPEKLVRWLDQKPNYAERIWRRILALYHNFRFPGGIEFGQWGVRILIACSGPALVYSYGTITLSHAITGAIVLLALYVAHDFLGLFSKYRPVDAATWIMVRAGDLISSMPSANGVHPGDRDNALAAGLGLIQKYARIVAQSEDDEIAATLLVYVNGDHRVMRIRKRNPGNQRPVGRPVECANLLGHHSCSRDSTPRAVHDLREFGETAFQSPTQSEVNYRSIFILPVTRGGEHTHEVLGFVSIDARRPYAFYGNRSRRIVVQCKAVILQMGMILDGELA